MAKLKVTGPDGNSVILNTPEGATAEAIESKIAQIKSQWTSPAATKPKTRGEEVLADLEQPGVAQRMLRGVPGLGGALDEIGAGADAALNFLSGGKVGAPYDESLTRRREAIAKSDEENPYENAALAIGGGLGLVPSLPTARIFTNPVAPTVTTRAADGALNAAGYAALTGFTEGEGGLASRLEKAGEYGSTGALVGGTASGIGQAILNRIGGTPQQSITRDAADLGVRIPAFMEGGRASQNIASKLGAIPFVGDDINDAVAVTRSQTGTAARNIAQNVAGGRVTPQEAGETVSRSSIDWTTGAARAAQDRVYGAIEREMQGVAAPLSSTRRAAAELTRQSDEAASPLHAAALQSIDEALQRPNGLSYEGLSRLRTQIGRMIDNSIDPNNATARAGLSAIYGALTDDMQSAITTRGGTRAQQLWQRANTVARQAAERRDTVARLVGTDGDKPGEAIVDRVVAMAGSKSSADAARLGQVRRAAGPDSWRQLSGAAIERLGRNQSNDFSPDIFLRNYRALSDNGRQLLFGSTGDDIIPDLERLATVSQRLQSFSRLGNPSGSGGVAAILTAMVGGAGGASGMATTAGTMMAGRGVGWLMSRPAVVRQASRYAATLERALRNPRGRGALSGATAALARIVSQETGEPPADIQARLEALY